MNFISKTLTRFYEWVYHPAFRYHKPSIALVYRYPSPGSQIRQVNLHNYKQPYIHSYYNVRFRFPTIHQAKGFSSIFAMDAMNKPTIVQKLIQDKLMTKEQQDDKEAIEAAKTLWFKKYKTPVEQSIYRNDFGWKIPEIGNAESFRYLIDMRTKVNNHQLKVLRGLDNYDRNYNTTQILMQSMDFMASCPQLQQMWVQVRYKIEALEKKNIEQGFIPTWSSNRNFWKALDNSNDSENISRVQNYIGDPTPLDFTLQNKSSDNKILIQEKGGQIRLTAP